MLDIRRLWVLREVARCGSFTAAAQSLAHTPSAVSQQIAAFEREVGVSLVQRRARGVVLTAPGRILVSEAEAIFNHLKSIERELSALAGMESGMLRLGWFATAGATLVSRAVAMLRARYPGIALDLFQGDPDECVAKLLAGELDLALVYQFRLEPPLRHDIEQIDLVEDLLHIGLPASHPLAQRDCVALADLVDEPWIQGVQQGSTLDVLPRACREAGFEPTIALRTDDRTVVEGLVAAGVGVALIPELTLPTVRPDIVVRSLDSRMLLRQVRVALPPGSYRSPATPAMLQIFREICADMKAEAARRLGSR